MWFECALWAIGDTLGKFIMWDDSYKSYNGRPIAQILVEIDVSLGLFESMALVIGDKFYTWIMDYVNFSFWCVRCHQYDYVLCDCDKYFTRQYWVKK